MRKWFALFLTLSSCLSPVYAATANNMVVSEHKLATQTGIEILRQGGNAIDAAVAIGYALAVVNPCCGNIGGGGFMTIHLANGKNIAINFREKAPLRAKENLYLNAEGQLISNASTVGYRAVAVPGTVLGLETARKRYGTLSRKKLMAPAIRLAKLGYRVSRYEADTLRPYTQEFRQQPNIAAIFLKHGRPLKAGDKLVQTDLANTLTQIATAGTDAFYKGAIAQAIVTASNEHGGILSLNDFAKYQVDITQPTVCQYRHYTIISSPIGSGAPTLCSMLRSLVSVPLQRLGHTNPQSIEAILKAMAIGFSERNQNTNHLPIDKVEHELTDTTHYSVVDRQGNAVAVTYTLNGFFGAHVMAGKTGFFLNDQMDDFTSKVGVANKFGLVQSNSNIIAPGKRPLSSMTPTIVLKDNHLYMVTGSPGGPRIMTALLLSLINVIDFGMTLPQAVNAPRYHYQVIPAEVDIEPNTFTPAILAALKKSGYQFKQQSTWSAVEAIMVVDPQTGKLTGVNDKRRPDGLAQGY